MNEVGHGDDRIALIMNILLAVKLQMLKENHREDGEILILSLF